MYVLIERAEGSARGSGGEAPSLGTSERSEARSGLAIINGNLTVACIDPLPFLDSWLIDDANNLFKALDSSDVSVVGNNEFLVLWWISRGFVGMEFELCDNKWVSVEDDELCVSKVFSVLVDNCEQVDELDWDKESMSVSLFSTSLD